MLNISIRLFTALISYIKVTGCVFVAANDFANNYTDIVSAFYVSREDL